jgi:exopolysaccharide production protein ExoQ
MATPFRRQWPRWAVCWLLLCQLGGLSIIDRILYGQWLGKPGDKFTQIINMSQIIISFILFVSGSRRWRDVRKGGLLALTLAVFLLCSATWSVEAGATVRGGIQYFFFLIGLIGAAENLEGDDFMDLLASVCFLSAVASLTLFFIAPDYAFSEETGEFRGVFTQKNLLGQGMAVGGLACLHSLRVGKRSRLSGMSMFVVITFVALKSESATSCLAILLFWVLGAVTQLLQRGGAARSFGVVLLASLLLIAPIVAVSPDSLLDLIGKDPTLTGRTDLWGYVTPYIYQRPWLGWGYDAFWSTQNPAAWEIANTIHWFSPQAHNGLLEILLNGGLVGAVWFIYLWARTFWLSLRCIRFERAMAITCFSCCAGILLEGVSEQVLLYVDGLTSVFFMSGFFCEKSVSRASLRRPVAVGNVVRFQSSHVAGSQATVK